jgi:hypothetical protein
MGDVQMPALPDIGPAPGPPAGSGTLSMRSASELYSPDDQAHLAADLEWALSYVSQRFGQDPTELIHVDVQQDAACVLNGLALTEQRRVQVKTCPEVPRGRVVNILAHELVHQLAHDYYGDRHLHTDMILLEGLATWGAGDYWLGGRPSFRAFVRQHYYDTDSILPLNTSYVGRSLDDMNRLYYQWGSFVEFLLERYGREKFDTLYVTGAQAPGSADYQGVYGKDLAGLEQEWLVWLAQ